MSQAPPDSPPEPSTPSASDTQPVSLSTKIFFGAPTFAGAAMAIPIAIHMPKFYSDVILAPIGLIAIAIAVARSLDALTDPLMGWISDRTRTRWGRRKPWIALGAPLTALALIALFSPPETLDARGAAAWFAVCFGLYFIFHTIYVIPHEALGAEISLDYHERSSLFAWRAFFIALGTIIAAAAPAAVLESLGKGAERIAFSSIACVIAVLLVSLYALMLWRVPERQDFSKRSTNPLVPGVRRALRNQPFRIIFLSGLTNAIPAAIPAILLPYMVEYVIQPERPDLWLMILLVTYMATGLVFIPIWMALSSRVGKLQTFVAAATVGITGSVLLFFITEGDTTFALLIFFLTGTQSQVGNVLMPAMAADTIDYDELLTGRRREAQFSSFWAIVPKFVAIPGSSIPLAILGYVGYQPNVAQSDEVVFTIRFLVGLFPALFYVAALLILTRYPITERAHRLIRDGIEAHAEGRTAEDPLTGRLIEPHRDRVEEDDRGWFLDYFSMGELRRALSSGLRRPLIDAGLCAAASLTLCILTGRAALAQIEDLTTDPGPGTVLAVVASGFSLTLFIFHVLRIRPAMRLGRGDCDEAEIRQHLAVLEADHVGTM